MLSRKTDIIWESLCHVLCQRVRRCRLGSRLNQYSMDPLVLALTYLILLRYAEVKFPPLCAGWSLVPTQELWDLHHVLSLHMHQDLLAYNATQCLRQEYPWQDLFAALPVVKQMWQTYVRRTIPLPVEVLTAGEWLEKRLQGTKPAFCLWDPLLHALTSTDSSGSSSLVTPAVASTNMNPSSSSQPPPSPSPPASTPLEAASRASDSARVDVRDDREESVSLSPPGPDDSPHHRLTIGRGILKW